MGARSYTLYWIIGSVIAVVIAGGTALLVVRKRRTKGGAQNLNADTD